MKLTGGIVMQNIQQQTPEQPPEPAKNVLTASPIQIEQDIKNANYRKKFSQNPQMYSKFRGTVIAE